MSVTRDVCNPKYHCNYFWSSRKILANLLSHRSPRTIHSFLQSGCLKKDCFPITPEGIHSKNLCYSYYCGVRTCTHTHHLPPKLFSTGTPWTPSVKQCASFHLRSAELYPIGCSQSYLHSATKSKESNVPLGLMLAGTGGSTSKPRDPLVHWSHADCVSFLKGRRFSWTTCCCWVMGQN